MLLMSVMMHCEAPDHPCSDLAGPVTKLNQMGQCACYLKKSNKCNPSSATEGGVHLAIWTIRQKPPHWRSIINIYIYIYILLSGLAGRPFRQSLKAEFGLTFGNLNNSLTLFLVSSSKNFLSCRRLLLPSSHINSTVLRPAIVSIAS